VGEDFDLAVSFGALGHFLPAECLVGLGDVAADEADRPPSTSCVTPDEGGDFGALPEPGRLVDVHHVAGVVIADRDVAVKRVGQRVMPGLVAIRIPG
jgi:hypothetical protein